MSGQNSSISLALKTMSLHLKEGRVSDLSRDVARMLFSIGAVEVKPSEPFTYASGLKGPIYCDNRKILSHIEARKLVKDAFVHSLNESGWEYDQLAGLATAGIAHAALVADALNKPMVYVRSKPKGHGKGNQIEGDYQSGQKVVLIEDLVNQGSSLDSALVGVQNAELRTSGCLSIVSYQMQKATEVAQKWSLPMKCLTDFDTLCAVAKEDGLIDTAGLELLQSWRVDPKNWSP